MHNNCKRQPKLYAFKPIPSSILHYIRITWCTDSVFAVVGLQLSRIRNAKTGLYFYCIVRNSDSCTTSNSRYAIPSMRTIRAKWEICLQNNSKKSKLNRRSRFSVSQWRIYWAASAVRKQQKKKRKLILSRLTRRNCCIVKKVKVFLNLIFAVRDGDIVSERCE